MTPRIDADERTAFRLVTRLFLKRLVDNDLISAHADRHESLALLYASVLSAALIVTFFVSTSYLSAFVQLPGPAALSALSDRFLFIAVSIAMGALSALMVWDALSLEPRDAAILGPLPISARTIAHAKLAAATMFGALLTVALNVIPSVLYPVFLTLNIRGTRGASLVRLMAGHATTVTLAGLFGFFGILALRGTFRLLLGERAFRRVASGVQSALVVGMVTALLLAPTVRAADVRRWVSETAHPRWPARPVLWYLGMNETLAGRLLIDIPVVLPPRFSFIAFPKQQDDAARAAYGELLPHFFALERRAWVASALTIALTLATFLWTNRRLPDRVADAPGRSHLGSIIHRLAERHMRNEPEAQAGFFFTLHTLTRSAAHRTIIAIAVAIGLTHALLVLARGAYAIQPTPLGVLGVAIMSLLSLLVGIRYAATMPAAPAANWTIRMAWLGDERGYLAGVKRAAMLSVAVLLVLLLPLHIALLGLIPAIVHSGFSALLATTACDVLFLWYRQLPFACSHVPLENPKLVWPSSIAALLAVAYGFAWVERWALHKTTSAIALGGALAAIALVVGAVDRTRRRERRPVNFDDRPRAATQQLGLFEHITLHD